MKTIEKILKQYADDTDFSFVDDFNTIIKDKVEQYDGSDKAKLKAFLEDLQHGGCQSGMIGDFIFHQDCKEFYIKHLEDLEAYFEDLEENLGCPIENKQKIFRPTFICRVSFEEYCYTLYVNVFE